MEDAFSELHEMVDSEMERTYSPTVIDHAMNPRNVGILRDANGWAKYTGPCGDTMEIWIKVTGGKIEDAHFWTDGCGTSIASGSMVSELAKGRSLRDAMEIDQQAVLEALGGLPQESEDCALLAAITLKLAVADYLERGRYNLHGYRDGR
jgi:nitrogen fixation NifU-like protein